MQERQQIYGSCKEPSYYDLIPQRLTCCAPKSKGLGAIRPTSAYDVDYVIEVATGKQYKIEDLIILLGIKTQRKFLAEHGHEYKVKWIKRGKK